jgi:hypothetical protein
MQHPNKQNEHVYRPVAGILNAFAMLAVQASRKEEKKEIHSPKQNN